MPATACDGLTVMGNHRNFKKISLEPATDELLMRQGCPSTPRRFHKLVESESTRCGPNFHQARWVRNSHCKNPDPPGGEANGAGTSPLPPSEHPARSSR